MVNRTPVFTSRRREWEIYRINRHRGKLGATQETEMCRSCKREGDELPAEILFALGECTLLDGRADVPYGTCSSHSRRFLVNT